MMTMMATSRRKMTRKVTMRARMKERAFRQERMVCTSPSWMDSK